MKYFIFSVLLSLGVVTSAYSADEPKEVKKVCIDVKDKDGKTVNDPKTGKPKQNCKDMKVHKKLEGTPVPEKKK